jgi:hypothetical protein
MITNIATPGLVDWPALHLGGMPAYERALRALEAGYLEIIDRNAEARASELQLIDHVEQLAQVCRDLAEIGADQTRLIAEQDSAIFAISVRLALVESHLRREMPISGEES